MYIWRGKTFPTSSRKKLLKYSMLKCKVSCGRHLRFVTEVTNASQVWFVDSCPLTLYQSRLPDPKSSSPSAGHPKRITRKKVFVCSHTPHLWKEKVTFFHIVTGWYFALIFHLEHKEQLRPREKSSYIWNEQIIIFLWVWFQRRYSESHGVSWVCDLWF